MVSVSAISYFGHHPKHEIIGYAQWFKSNTASNGNNLDVGSNVGTISNMIAADSKSVFAVEIDFKFNERAKRECLHNNVFHINDDILNFLEKKENKFDTVILSNVLEHISDRTKLLNLLNESLVDNGKLLIRVPQFDRDWITPLKKELKIEWRTDPTHVLEYTEAELYSELSNANFEVESIKFQFSEIYAIARIKK